MRKKTIDKGNEHFDIEKQLKKIKAKLSSVKGGVPISQLAIHSKQESKTSKTVSKKSESEDSDADDDDDDSEPSS